MNLSLRDTGGALLLVPQFTLAADTRNGTRAGFTTAAPPDEARRLFDYLVGRSRIEHDPVATGDLRREHAGLAHQRRTCHVLDRVGIA